MSLLLLRRVLGGRTLVTLSFSTSQTWTCPPSTTKIESVTGQGGAGQDDYYSGGAFHQGGGDVEYHTHYSAYDPAYDYDGYSYGTWSGSTVPPNQYHPVNMSGSTVYYDGYSEITYSGTDAYYDDDVYHPSTTGPGTSAFGCYFSGNNGSGNPPPATFNNITVTPGNVYTLSIVAGTTLTFTFWK